VTRAVEILADNIRRCRVARKLTLKELAEQVGVSVAYLSDIENMKRNPSCSVADRIENALHTTGIVDQARDVVIERWNAQ
jgi:transcriptional regulator with XRE-family HTH domain